MRPPMADGPRLMWSVLKSVDESATTANNYNKSHHNHHTTTILRPFFRDHPGELVPEENFWTLWCKGRLIEADTLTIRLGATQSGLSRAHLHHPLIFFTGRMPFLPPNRQRQTAIDTDQWNKYDQTDMSVHKKYKCTNYVTLEPVRNITDQHYSQLH